MVDRSFPLAGYRRALRFVIPYWRRLFLVLLTGLAATSLGLAQPYISKLLIDDALFKHNMRMLLIVSGMMFGVTVLGFALKFSPATHMCECPRPCCSTCGWRCTGISKRCRRVSGRSNKLGDVISRINNDIAEVQRVSADSLLSVLSNVVFLIGSIGIMVTLSPRLFLVQRGGGSGELVGAPALPAAAGGQRARGARAQLRHRQLSAGNPARHPAGCVLAGRIARSRPISSAQPELSGCAAAHATDVFPFGRRSRHDADASRPPRSFFTAASW